MVVTGSFSGTPVAPRIKKIGRRAGARYRKKMRWQNRVFQAWLLVLLGCLCQCKQPLPSAAKTRTSIDLLAMIPAQVPGVLWAPDFEKGLAGVVDFASVILEPNAFSMFDAFRASTGVDMRTAHGWDTAGVDTNEGLALLVGGMAAPTLVVRTRDSVRLDKFINLYAMTRSETDGHAIGDVHGTTVHSYRGVHWSHVGAYTWLTLGRDGRVAMHTMLQHIRREDDVVAPDHPMTADGNFAQDMNQVQAANWMGWRGGTVGTFGPWALALDVGKKGVFSQLYVGGDANTVSSGMTGLDALVQRFSEHDLMFLATQHVDIDDMVAPEPATPAPKRGRAGARAPAATAAAIDANKRAPSTEAIEQAFTELTGLHWRTDIAPDIRGVTMGLGLATSETPALSKVNISITVDVADASKAAGWMVRATQTMAQQNVVFRPTVETLGGVSFTSYRSEYAVGPGLAAQGNDWRLVPRLAVVGKTIVLAVGPDAFDDQLHALLDPAAALHPLVSGDAQAARVARAQNFAALRLGRIGSLLAKWAAAGSKVATVDANTLLMVAQAWQHMGDVTETSTQVARGRVIEMNCGFAAAAAAAAGPNGQAAQPVPVPESQRVENPVLAMLPQDPEPEKYWLHTSVGRAASFVSNVHFNERIFLSQTDSVRVCRHTCWENPRCLGFFEQTKACPEPRRNDHKGDPTRTRGRGCVRLCGFYTEGQNPTHGTLTAGPTGSVWLKSDTFGKGVTPDKWFGNKAQRAAGP